MRRDLAKGTGLGGYRSGVAAVRGGRVLVAVGATGSDFSDDFGRTWRTIPSSGLNAVAGTADGFIWAVGARGAIAKFSAEN